MQVLRHLTGGCGLEKNHLLENIMKTIKFDLHGYRTQFLQKKKFIILYLKKIPKLSKFQAFPEISPSVPPKLYKI